MSRGVKRGRPATTLRLVSAFMRGMPPVHARVVAAAVGRTFDHACNMLGKLAKRGAVKRVRRGVYAGAVS